MSKADHEHYERERGRYVAETKWYAMLVHCGRERKIYERIRSQWDEREITELLLPEVHPGVAAAEWGRLLFPGHLFLRCRMGDELYLSVSALPGVHKILGRAWRIPSVIEDAEMEIFKGVLRAAPASQLVPSLRVGAVARVTDGPMRGLRGRVIEVTTHHVKIEAEFSFLDGGTSIAVCVPQGQVWIEDGASRHARAGRPASA